MGVDLNDCRNSNRPDGQDNNFGWVIKRADSDGVMKLIVLSHDILGLRTHWFRGRTGPCMLVKCDACLHKQLSRWKGYLLCVEASTQQQIVFEFTPPAVKPLDEAMGKYGTMRGLQLHVARSAKRANARVVVSVKGATVLGPGACPAFSVWPILARIWGIASDDERDIELGDVNDISMDEKVA